MGIGPLAACGGGSEVEVAPVAGYVPRSVVVSAACPTEREDGLDKVLDLADLSAAPSGVRRAAVWLRPPAATEGDCHAAEGCGDEDAALRARADLLAQALRCVVQPLQQNGPLDLVPVWFDEPRRLSSGTPVPELTAFALLVDQSHLETLAAHPYVDRITAAPAASFAPRMAAAPAACPRERESPRDKLLHGPGPAVPAEARRPVIVRLVDDGLLPAAPSCRDACRQADLDVMWLRTLESRRALTCVAYALDATVGAAVERLPYDAGDAYFAAAPVPPLGLPAGTLRELSTSLTAAEAEQLAAHPYVLTVTDQLGFEPAAPTRCEPSGYAPPTECPVLDPVQAGAGKLSAAAIDTWRNQAGPHEVLIGLHGGAMSCPLPECPAGERECAAATQHVAQREQENRARQACARALIAALGGQASDEVFWLINGFVATLTWEQIQIVSGHPDVRTIERNRSDAPPP
ncbi:MAG: hypothetical protein ABW321_02475, partial [Polyangiales bacterium]